MKKTSFANRIFRASRQIRESNAQKDGVYRRTSFQRGLRPRMA
jgi:hypothetical protein